MNRIKKIEDFSHHSQDQHLCEIHLHRTWPLFMEYTHQVLSYKWKGKCPHNATIKEKK